MLPSNWTSTYNYQYRDPDTRIISPHQGEPMYHYNGNYDPSHHQRQHGYFGTRALAIQQRTRAQSASLNLSSTAFTPRYATSASSSLSSSQPLPQRASTSSGIIPPVNFRSNGYSVFTPSQPLPITSTSRPSKDLWTHPIVPHTGVYSSYTSIPGITSRVHGLVNYNDYEDKTGMTNTGRGSARDLKDRYHVPGYQGFIRGMQFTHGDTYGKTTRRCLDVPTDVPLEP